MVEKEPEQEKATKSKSSGSQSEKGESSVQTYADEDTSEVAKESEADTSASVIDDNIF